MLDGLAGRPLHQHTAAGRVRLQDGLDPAAAQPGQQASQELVVEPADQLGGTPSQLPEGAVAQQELELGRGAGGRIAAGGQQLADDGEGAFGAEPAKPPLDPDPLA